MAPKLFPFFSVCKEVKKTIFVSMIDKRRYSLVLSVCATLLWGLPALYVIVWEFISLGRFIAHWSQYSQPFSYIGADIIFLLFALLVVAAVVCVWIGDRKLKKISSVFLFVLSLLLIPIVFVAVWYGAFMNDYMGKKVAHQYSSLVAVLAYPVAGMLLSILLFIHFSKRRKME
jgi:putative effector of murein hydrolase LrgA (UPF0299 family)